MQVDFILEKTSIVNAHTGEVLECGYPKTAERVHRFFMESLNFARIEETRLQKAADTFRASEVTRAANVLMLDLLKNSDGDITHEQIKAWAALTQ